MNKINDLEKRPLSLAEAARWLGVSRTKIKDMLISGEIKYELIKDSTPRSNVYEIDYDSVVKLMKKDND